MRSSLFVRIASLLLVGATLFVMASCSLTGDTAEEESTTEPPIVEMEARPADEAAALDFYNRAVNRIKAETPGVSFSRSARVQNIDTGDCPEADALIRFARSFSDALDGTGESTEYGTDLTDLLPIKGTPLVSRLSMADVKKVELTDDEGDPHFYLVHIELQDGDRQGAVANAFDLDIDKSEVLGNFTDYQNLLEVSDYDVTYNECTIDARINKEDNRVDRIDYTLNSDVTTEVNFTGSLASLGEAPVAFRLQQSFRIGDLQWEAPTETETQEG